MGGFEQNLAGAPGGGYLLLVVVGLVGSADFGSALEGIDAFRDHFMKAVSAGGGGRATPRLRAVGLERGGSVPNAIGIRHRRRAHFDSGEGRWPPGVFSDAPSFGVLGNDFPDDKQTMAGTDDFGRKGERVVRRAWHGDGRGPTS